MDRLNKNRTGKVSKSHQPFAGSGELIALGKVNKDKGSLSSSIDSDSRKPTSSKASVSSTSTTKPTSKGSGSISSSSGSKSSGERKRDAGSSNVSSQSSNPNKKVRLQAPGTLGSSFLSATSTTSSSSKASHLSTQSKPVKISKREHSVEDAEEIDSNDLSGDKFLSSTEKARKSNDPDKAQALLLAAMKKLRHGKEKPDVNLCLGLLRMSKWFGNILRTAAPLEMLCSLVTIKRPAVDVKIKMIQQNPSILSPLAISMICNSFEDINSVWPIAFVQMWAEDACGDRLWVDNPLCKSFVDNLVFSFNTKIPPSNLLLPLMDQITGPAGGSSPSVISGDSDSVFQKELVDMLEENTNEMIVQMRYNGREDEIEVIVLNIIRDIIAKKAPDVPKSVLRALCSSCGLPGVRSLVTTRLEQWVHNPKCGRQAQELLLYLCVNSHCNTSSDSEIVLQIAKMRIKTKPLANGFAVAVKEMVRENEANLKLVLHQVVHNELSPARNTNNFTLFGAILTSCSAAHTILADIFLDLFQKREDFLGALRLLLREIVRSTRHEFDLVLFVRGLLKEKEFNWRDTETRERGFKAIVDLIIISMFLALTPSVKEAGVVRGDSKKDLGVISVFQSIISKIQEEALVWMYSSVPTTFRPTKKDFLIAFNKLLLKDPTNEVQTRDGWPQDSERCIFARLTVETPIGEESLMWVFFQGISKEHNYISSGETLDLIDFIVIRSATHSGILQLEKMEIIEFLFRLCEYKHPENITLPVGYAPPKLAISKLYWRAWIVLAVITAYSPSTFGKMAWDNYPMLKAMMEMCMTNHFLFPTVSADASEDILGKERQAAALEKEEILEFETHLAAASTKSTITEKNSLLLPQLLRLEPLGKARTPPGEVLAQLQSLNEALHLGHRLCKSRNPDFLVDLIQRNSQPMPWLSELVSEGSFENLPVQCLCEFMLGQTERVVKALNLEINKSSELEVSGSEKANKKIAKAASELIKEDVKGMQLLHYLKDVVHGSQDDLSREVLEYFFRRLASKKTQSRMQALQGIQLLLSSPKKPLDENWLLDSIPTVKIFSDIQESITVFLRHAIQVENEPKWIAHYLEFLSTWSSVDTATSDIEGLALDVSQLVVERNGVMSALITYKPKSFDSLFVIFLNYVKKIREPHQETHKWSETAEQVLVQWPVEKLEASLNILIIHAIVILLTSFASKQLSTGPSKQHDKKKTIKAAVSQTELKYNELLDIWFPKDSTNNPKGFLLNTSEEAVLYPDWIKLRMIRSNNSRLLAAALLDLEVDQLMLFVQSFGIPVKSMTALLYCVDTSVDKSPDKVSSVVADAQYMNTLVELQWKRGASGGEKFSRMLKHLIGKTSELKPVETSKESAPKFKTRPPLESFPSTFRFSNDVKVLDCTRAKRLTQDTKSKKATDKDSQLIGRSGKLLDNEDIRGLSRMLLSAASSASATIKRRSSSTSFDGTVPRTLKLHVPYLDQISESVKSGGFPGNNIGELVDKFRDLEPSIVCNALDVQLPLLFGRNDVPPPCRSFLLTVLTHESGWDTVEHCLTLFLKEFSPSYDPSTILDLIFSTIKNPKLWQGCDKYVPKHQPLESVFHLTDAQLLVMAEYIIEEISQLEVKNTTFSISNLLGPGQSSSGKTGRKTKHCLQQRVLQWLRCCNNNKEVVDTIITNLTEKKGSNPSTRKFIYQVYLEFPEVILVKTWINKSEELGGSEDDVSCILDAVSHTLITAAANVQGGKDWYKKVTNECEICLRKIASVHPVLLLRQLPLMGGLLEGRVHLEFSAFHAENHHVPFQVFLGLIDLMQPHVLKHFKTLKSIFTLYIKLFANFGHQRDYSAALGRFSVLLHNLLSTNPIEMKEFLTLHYVALKELATVKYYSDVGPFQNLMTSIVPPSGDSELSLLTANSSEMDPFSMSSGPSTAIFVRLQTAKNPDEVVPILQELDTLSNRNPAVLQKFSDNLIPLVLSENDNCRNLAFSLILKHMTYCPSVNTIYLKVVLQALQTSSSHLKDSLMDRLHEFVVLAQENAAVILKQMFELGISSNVNILPAITRTLGLLRSQTGAS